MRACLLERAIFVPQNWASKARCKFSYSTLTPSMKSCASAAAAVGAAAADSAPPRNERVPRNERARLRDARFRPIATQGSVITSPRIRPGRPGNSFQIHQWKLLLRQY